MGESGCRQDDAPEHPRRARPPHGRQRRCSTGRTSPRSRDAAAMAAFRREHLGFVFQEFNLLDTFTLEDNIYLPLVLAGMPYLRDEPAPAAPSPGSSALRTIAQKVPLRGLRRAEAARGGRPGDHHAAEAPAGGRADGRARLARDGRAAAPIRRAERAGADHPHGDAFCEGGEHAPGACCSSKTASVFHQLYRGEATNEQFYQKIAETLTMLTTGGERA